ncbi:MAG: hypothetical protein SGCHY_004845 [Lobulomycetales sp.]
MDEVADSLFALTRPAVEHLISSVRNSTDSLVPLLVERATSAAHSGAALVFDSAFAPSSSLYDKVQTAVILLAAVWFSLWTLRVFVGYLVRWTVFLVKISFYGALFSCLAYIFYISAEKRPAKPFDYDGLSL